MKTILAVLLFLICVAFFGALNAFVLMKLWIWFVPLEVPSFWQIWGMNLMVQTMRAKYEEPKKDELEAKVAFAVIIPLVALTGGAILYLIGG